MCLRQVQPMKEVTNVQQRSSSQAAPAGTLGRGEENATRAGVPATQAWVPETIDLEGRRTDDRFGPQAEGETRGSVR